MDLRDQDPPTYLTFITLRCVSCLFDIVVPRPIALTSTQAPDGTVNLAPFSYFNTMGHDPPTLAISICRNGNGSKKDSLVNIEANGCVATGNEPGELSKTGACGDS